MRSIRSAIYLSVLVSLSQFVTTQTGVQFRTVTVNEQSGKIGLLQMDDKAYIDLNRLVQIAHGSIDYRGNQIVLTLPSGGAPAAMAEAEEPKDSALTHGFMKAGIEAISLMREWASNLANDIQNGYPVSENWVSGYRTRAESGLAAASAATSSDADRNGYNLLKREFEAVQEWSNKLLQARKSMDAAKYAVSDTALQNDPLSQRIIACGRFVGQMLASGTFQADPVCH